MTEKEFIREAEILGIKSEEAINGAIRAYKIIKESFPKASLNDFLSIAKRHQDIDSNGDTVSVCGGATP